MRASFDRHVMVDWSATAAPKRGADSIWISVVDDDGSRSHNPSTRAAAIGMLGELVADGARTLIGVDASLGFPSGTAAAFGLTHGGDGPGRCWAATASMLADRIVDDVRNRNNRFEVAAELNAAVGPGPGPFWGCPPARAGAALTPTRPADEAGALSTWRTVEQLLRSDGHRPFSCWQLLGAGSVGSQSLTAIAALERWRRAEGRRGRRVDVWPFTTGLAVPEPLHRIVIAEVWPSLWPVVVAAGEVKDAAQVRVTCDRFRAADASGALTTWFSPRVRECIATRVTAEEGWVLGVTP